MEEINEALLRLAGGTLFLLLILVGCPCLMTLGCWFFGKIAAYLVGNLICTSLAILNISITAQQIPYLAIALGWIGYFFNLGISITNEFVMRTVAIMFGEELIEEDIES